MALIDKLAAIANAIRSKTGGTTPLTLNQMATEIEGISVGGGSAGAEGGFVDKTITTYTNNKIKLVGSYAFYQCSNLTYVSFPACERIYNYAFQETKLTTANFPVCTSIGTYGFFKCYPLISANFPVCKSVGDGVFYQCYSLASVNFPACEYIGAQAFYQCSNLTTANFPACISIRNGAFTSCSKLTSVNFPVCVSISDYAFTYCSSLTTVSFPACVSIGKYAFSYCTNLKEIYLMGSSLCVLSNSNAFSVTSIWSNKGSIFVPASLVETYKAATNWAYFKARIFSAS